MSDKIRFDVDSLTFAETIDFEDISEMPITSLGDPQAKMGRAALAMAYIVLRRTTPTLTLDEVKAMPIAATIDLGGAGPVDPTDGDASKPSA